ncbi:MAG: 6-carboxytetrahydropterin synthase QueD [Planctomycetes bacterium]|nr:6-carboxytetrahydropterin synthase QueD [Planctomycetota bacterium]
MKAELVKTFRFDAAHALPNVPHGHKCASPHGHSYRVDIHVVGDVDPHAGWVMDFGQIKAIVGPLIDQLDHCNLNDVPGLANSTSELLAAWLWERIRPRLPQLSAITVHESESAKCIYRGQ